MSAASANSSPSSKASPLTIATVGFESTASDSTRRGSTAASKPTQNAEPAPVSASMRAASSSSTCSNSSSKRTPIAGVRIAREPGKRSVALTHPRAHYERLDVAGIFWRRAASDASSGSAQIFAQDFAEWIFRQRLDELDTLG